MNWHIVWFDPNSGRLRSGWRVLAFLGMAAAFFFSMLLLFSLLLPFETPPKKIEQQYLLNLTFVLALIPATIAAGIWALRSFDRLPPRTLGVTPEGAWARQLALGILFGLVLATVGVMALWATGAATVRWQGLGETVLLVIGGAGLFMLAVGLAEELLFRGYIFQTLLRGIGPLLTLVVTSLLFALFHLGNANLSLLGVTNIFVAGILFGMLYLRTGLLWMPIGLHMGWNYALVLFGTPVSGNAVGLPTPFVTTVTPAYAATISGGAFGLEGSVIGSIVLLGAVALVTYWRSGLTLESRWWEWRGFLLTTEVPQNWDFTVGSRHYQWKLQEREQGGE